MAEPELCYECKCQLAEFLYKEKKIFPVDLGKYLFLHPEIHCHHEPKEKPGEPTLTSFMGKPIKYWRELEDWAREQGVDGPKDLHTRTFKENPKCWCETHPYASFMEGGKRYIQFGPNTFAIPHNFCSECGRKL